MVTSTIHLRATVSKETYCSDVQQKTEDGLTYTALSFMLQLNSGSKNGTKFWFTCIIGDYIQTTMRANRQEIPILFRIEPLKISSLCVSNSFHLRM